MPIEAAAPDSTLVVNMDPAKPLGAGSHIFQLEVVDNSGNRSQPAKATVVVLDDQAPTAVISPTGLRCGVGKPSTLSGRDSCDAGGGTIVKYIWTLIQ